MPAPRKPRTPGGKPARRNLTSKRSNSRTSGTNAAISFGPEICGDLAAAEQREWLVTNGVGGFASGTIAGTSTRRYHGLLFAALQPPVDRTLLVSGIDETARYGAREFSLA